MAFQDGVAPDASYGGTSDAIIALDYPGVNLGGLENVETFYETSEWRRSLLRWDIAALPAGIEVESARVELYHFHEPGGSGEAMDVALHLVTREWTEGTGYSFGGSPDGATWNAASPGTSWTSPGGDYDSSADYGHGANGIIGAASLPAGPWEGWVALDATAAVRAWVEDGTPNRGVLVRPLGGDYTYNYYRSREYGTAARRPRLVVEYRAAGGGFPLRVSFRPAASDPPDGFSRDDGSAYATHGAWSYGWR